MRESLLSMRFSVLAKGPPLTKKKFQQPAPKGVASVLSARHWPSGKSPAFWSDLGGTPYVATLMNRPESEGCALGEFRELVFEICQSSIWLKVPSLENTANELKNDSVPPWEVS